MLLPFKISSLEACNENSF